MGQIRVWIGNTLHLYTPRRPQNFNIFAGMKSCNGLHIEMQNPGSSPVVIRFEKKPVVGGSWDLFTEADKLIDEYEFSRHDCRIKPALIAGTSEFETIGHIASLTKKEIEAIPGIGPKYAAIIIADLTRDGIYKPWKTDD